MAAQILSYLSTTSEASEGSFSEKTCLTEGGNPARRSQAKFWVRRRDGDLKELLTPFPVARMKMWPIVSQGSTHEGKFAPAGVIQIHEVLPVEYSSPIKRPWTGRFAALGNSPW